MLFTCTPCAPLVEVKEIAKVDLELVESQRKAAVRQLVDAQQQFLRELQCDAVGRGGSAPSRGKVSVPSTLVQRRSGGAPRPSASASRAKHMLSGSPVASAAAAAVEARRRELEEEAEEARRARQQLDEEEEERREEMARRERFLRAKQEREAREAVDNKMSILLTCHEQAERLGGSEKSVIDNFLQAQGFKDINAPKRSYLRTTYPLHKAVELGDVPVVRALLAKGVAVRQKDSSGRTPVQVAQRKVSTAHAAIVQLLVDATN